MTLQEKIRQDLKISMKAKNEARTSALRVMLGEFGRQNKKELSDPEVIAIIRKLVKAEQEVLSKTKATSSEYLSILEEFLPKEPSEAEIRQWISANIDFSSFNNKMQAMRPIMAHFAGSVDGNTVKKILESL